MRASRSSRSFSLTWTGSSSGGVEAHPAMSAVSAKAARSVTRRMAAVLLRLWGLGVGIQILDPASPVLGPRGLIMPRRRRALFAVADGGQLHVTCALQQQRAPYSLRTSLTEADVVLTRASLVRVAFEANTSG